MSQPNVWIIDHRDSFTWNLAELVRMTGMAVPRVVSNESPELEQAVQAGDQILGVRFGARLEHLSRPLHGAREVICRTEQCPLLEGLPEQFPAALYHSWRLAAFPWPAELIVTARDSGKNVQAIRHRHLPLYGIQFHPESILTPDGEALLRNFLSLPAGSREKRRIQ